MIFIAKSAGEIFSYMVQKYIYLADIFIQIAPKAESNLGIELSS